MEARKKKADPWADRHQKRTKTNLIMSKFQTELL